MSAGELNESQPVLWLFSPAGADGAPLGLELAATWLRLTPCCQIAEQIRQDVDFLTTSLRNVPERHRSLRAVFDHSWQLLSEPERQVLAKLTVFRGGFDTEAAAWVASASLPVLAGLVDKSMVRCDAHGRYDLHELLRQYAAAKLTEQGQEQLSHQHFDYFLDLAAQGEPYLLYGGPGKLGWVERLDAEIDNLRAASAWSLACDDSALRVQLSATLGHFWMCTARWREGYTWIERALPDSSTAPLAVQAAALTGFGRLMFSFPGDIQRAESICQEALRLARESGDRAVLERALANAGYFGDSRNAIPLIEEAVRLNREWGNKGALLNALHVQAMRTMDTGDYERALALQEEGLALAREIQEPTLTGWSLYCMAEITLLQGNLSRTMDLCQECLGLGVSGFGGRG
jgi:tetratricopeptide (TPR) repeat protein